jgi:hypothetical protein
MKLAEPSPNGPHNQIESKPVIEAERVESERLEKAMSRATFKGQVAETGFGHFSKCRPKFYQIVLDLSGLSLHKGTINVRIDGEMPHFPMSKTQRIPGQDQIDLDDNQDIFITPCLMEGWPGFWILPVFKGSNRPNPKGHWPKGIIEVSLVEKLPSIAPGLEVSLEILGGNEA